MTRSRRNPARSGAAGVLVLVVSVLLPLTLAARWADDTVADTDGYVAVADEVVADPAVQAALADQLTTQVVGQVPATGVGTVDTGVRGIVEGAVQQAVASDTFASVWSQANRTAHSTVLALLQGETSRVTLDDSGQVVLELGAVADAVTARIVESGLVSADAIPTFDTSVPLFQSSALDDARTGYEALTLVATWAPWVALAVLVLALALAYSRGLVLLWVGVLSAVGTGLLMAALGLLSERATLAVTSPSVSPALVGSITDVFTESAQHALRTGLVVSGALVVVGIVVLLVEKTVRSHRV